MGFFICLCSCELGIGYFGDGDTVVILDEIVDEATENPSEDIKIEGNDENSEKLVNGDGENDDGKNDDDETSLKDDDENGVKGDDENDESSGKSLEIEKEIENALKQRNELVVKINEKVEGKSSESSKARESSELIEEKESRDSHDSTDFADTSDLPDTAISSDTDGETDTAGEIDTTESADSLETDDTQESVCTPGKIDLTGGSGSPRASDTPKATVTPKKSNGSADKTENDSNLISKQKEAIKQKLKNQKKESEDFVIEDIEEIVDDVEEVSEKEVVDENTDSDESGDTEAENAESDGAETDDTEVDGTETGGVEEIVEEVKIPSWSILVYMAADNNLETAAITDFIEMEASVLNTEEVSVFVLLDRNPADDSSDSNWSGTKLFRLKTHRNDSSRNLLSEELVCPDLNLSLDYERELDTSSGYVLSGALNFIQREFPAENYGLILWGHGSGFKGFAYDETSKTYMTLDQLEGAISSSMAGKKLGFFGFDTCFGATAEVMYQIKDCAEYAVGSEGLVKSAGWNYSNLMNVFERVDEKTPKAMAMAVLEQFKQSYESINNASCSVINLAEVKTFVSVFDDYMAQVSDLIVNRKIRNEILGILYSNANCQTEKYTYGTDNSDIYLDINSLVSQLSIYLEDYQSELSPYLTKFNDSVSKMIVDSWNSKNTNPGLSLYFSTLGTGNLLVANHPLAYVNGKSVNQIDFVSDCQSYVPSVSGQSSFLDKLFYKNF